MQITLMPVAMVLFSLSQPSVVDCIGEGLGRVCINPMTGEVWSAADDYVEQNFGRAGPSAKSTSSKVAKYPSAAAGSQNAAPSDSGGAGITTVLQSTPQNGNAEVLTTPDGSAGAVVLGNDAAAAAVCGTGVSC